MKLVTHFTNGNSIETTGVTNYKELDKIMEKKKNFIKIANTWINLNNITNIEMRDKE